MSSAILDIAKGSIDECHRELVKGELKPELKFALPTEIPVLRYALLMIQHPYGNLSIVSNPSKESLIETLASDLEESLLKDKRNSTPRQIKVISADGTTDSLERLKWLYPTQLQVAYAVTKSPQNSQFISPNCALTIKQDMTGSIYFNRNRTGVEKEMFDFTWMILTDSVAYEKWKRKPASKIMNWLFGKN
jgi:hypothetical protein